MRRRRRWLAGLALGLLASPWLLIALFGWLPPPTTAFMLQSPTRPVDYRWVGREDIAEVMRRAVVAAEDQKFWRHAGFDLEALRAAYARNQRGGRIRGGSTISQQTAKNLFLWPGGGYLRKGLEAGLTVGIELLWSKPRILEVYLNIAEFGPGIYGVEAAAQRYFGKPAARLSAAEAARLAAVLPSPRKWKVIGAGPYVQKRSAWILRQIGQRPPPVAEPEPLPPPAAGDDPGDEPPEAPAASATAASAEPETGAAAPIEPAPSGDPPALAEDDEPEPISPDLPPP